MNIFVSEKSNKISLAINAEILDINKLMFTMMFQKHVMSPKFFDNGTFFLYLKKFFF